MFGKALVKEIALCSVHLTVSLLFIPVNGQSDIINDEQENYLIINANSLYLQVLSYGDRIHKTE